MAKKKKKLTQGTAVEQAKVQLANKREADAKTAKAEAEKTNLNAKDPTREELRQKQINERGPLDTQEEVMAAQDLLKRQEAAKELLTPEEPIEEPEDSTEPSEEVKQPRLLSDLSDLERLNLGHGRIATNSVTGELVVLDEPATGLSAGGALLAGGVAGGAAVVSGLTPSVSSFLSKAFTGGKVATSTKGALTASIKLKGIVGKMGTVTKLIIGGGIAKITNDLLTSNIKAIEGEVGKAGEQLTKIPEAASLGFSLDEDGNLFEYTAEMALEEIESVEQALLEAEEALQVASIGKAVLKITGRFNKAQLEIDKQKRELTVARGKILTNVIANPSESLLNSREFFRGLELT